MRRFFWPLALLAALYARGLQPQAQGLQPPGEGVARDPESSCRARAALALTLAAGPGTGHEARAPFNRNPEGVRVPETGPEHPRTLPADDGGPHAQGLQPPGFDEARGRWWRVRPAGRPAAAMPQAPAPFNTRTPSGLRLNAPPPVYFPFGGPAPVMRGGGFRGGC